MKKSSVLDWHKWFKECYSYVEESERSGHSRPHRTNENVEKVQYLVHSYR
jgi:hypothetical protein